MATTNPKSTQLILQTFGLIVLGMLVGWAIGYFLAQSGVPIDQKELPPDARVFGGAMWGVFVGGGTGIFAAAGIAWWQGRRRRSKAPEEKAAV